MIKLLILSGTIIAGFFGFLSIGFTSNTNPVILENNIDSPLNTANVSFQFNQLDDLALVIDNCVFTTDENLVANTNVFCKLLDESGNFIAEGNVFLNTGFAAGNTLPIPLLIPPNVQLVHGAKIIVFGPEPAVIISTTLQTVVNFVFEPENNEITACSVKFNDELPNSTVVTCRLTGLAGISLTENNAMIVDSDGNNITVLLANAQDIQDVHDVKVEILFACNGVTATIVGTPGADTLDAPAGTAAIIVGLGGADTINGRGQADTICGGAGNDTIDAQGGDDIIFGEDDDDTIFGKGGSDTIFGGPGDDNIDCGGGFDTAFGGDGTDINVGNNCENFTQ